MEMLQGNPLEQCIQRRTLIPGVGVEEEEEKKCLRFGIAGFPHTLTVASPCQGFTEGLLIHTFFAGRVRLG